MSDTCEWEYEQDGFHQTGCGRGFTFEEGDVIENGFRFCPYCGKEIVVEGEAE